MSDIENTAPRICLVTNDFAGVIRNGGIGTHFELMSRILSDRGWNVQVLFCGVAEDKAAMAHAPAQLAERGIQFTWLEEMPAPSWADLPQYGDGMPPWLLDSQRAFEALESMHADHRFDLIEFSDWGALGFRSAQAKQAGIAFGDCRLAVKLHSPTEWQRRGNLAPRQSAWDLKMEWCERYAFEHADIQLSPSHYMLADTRAQDWDVRDDAVVAYPFPYPEPAADKPTSGSGDIAQIVFFGRLERRKGLHLFLDALEVVDPDFPVLFLGKDSFIDGRKATELIAERMADRPHRVETELNREQALAELLRGDSLAVMASQSETFGFTVAECVANEVPFLAADAGGVPEVVIHGPARDRWLFEPTVDGLSVALDERLAAPIAEERELRSTVAEACDPERWNDRIEDIYRKLVARPLPAVPPAPTGATVAVAITYFNHPRHLPAALDSIARQTQRPDEVLVVDDGSTEVEARRVFDQQEALYPDWTFLRQENAGPGAARNRCLKESSSEWFLPFDSDNIAAPDLVEMLVGATRDGRDAATCHLIASTEPGKHSSDDSVFRYAPTGGPRALTVLENVFGDTCGLFRAKALRDVGGFETVRWSPHEDWETYTKLAFAGYRVDVVPRVLLYYRAAKDGRLEELTNDPAKEHRLRRRMIHTILADVPLDAREQAELFECLLGFAAPDHRFDELLRAHDELSAWAHSTIADANAWHEEELERLREWLTGQVEEANARADRAEAAMAGAVLSSPNSPEAPSPVDGASGSRLRVALRAGLGRTLGDQRAANSVIAARQLLGMKQRGAPGLGATGNGGPGASQLRDKDPATHSRHARRRVASGARLRIDQGRTPRR